jgi:hypothetical protein
LCPALCPPIHIHLSVPTAFHHLLQVLAQNLINAPGLNLTFTDPQSLVLTEESKAALRAAAYQAAVNVPFNTWATPPLATPVGQLNNEVPVDKNGAARGSSDLPGVLV